MDAHLRSLVRKRAGDRCEYCLLPQSAASFLRFHVEHIRARQHGGTDDPDNLALACPDCNAHKGPNLTAIDPDTNQLVQLFNPRIDRWTEHFTHVGAVLQGVSAVGRATVALLMMNDPDRVEMRAEIAKAGGF